MNYYIKNIEKAFVLVLMIIFTSANLVYGTALRPALTSDNPLNQEKIKVAVIGLGKWAGRSVMPNLHKNSDVKVCVVLPRSEDNRAEWGKLKTEKGYEDIDEVESLDMVLEDPDIKAVFITTRDPESHFELAKKCLLSGKNVSIAKPIRGVHAKELLEIAKEKKLLVDIGLQLMYDPDVLYLKDCIEENKHLGKVISVELNLLNTKSTVDKTMTAFDNLGVHLLSMLQVIMGVSKASDIEITSNPDDCLVKVSASFNVYKDVSVIPVVLNTDNRNSGTSDCRKIKINFDGGFIELDILTRQVSIGYTTGKIGTIILGQEGDYVTKYGDKNAVGTEINRFLDLIEKKDILPHSSSLSDTLWIWDFVDKINELLGISIPVTAGIAPNTGI